MPIDRKMASRAVIRATRKASEPPASTAGCVTRDDGECVSVDRCVHGPSRDETLGAALRAALATVGIGNDLRVFMLGGEHACAVIESDDTDVNPENAATCALEYALRASLSGDRTDG